MDQQLRDLETVLDWTYEQLLAGEVAFALIKLCDTLREYYRTTPQEYWQRVIKPYCLQHRVRKLLHQDPYTYRAFTKPRGYAGDAVTIDYIYHKVAPLGTTRLGQELFDVTTTGPDTLSVRARCDMLAAIVDEVAETVSKPNILAVACGHLREAERSVAVQKGEVGNYIALDQDPENLMVVQSNLSSAGVRVVHAPIKSLLRGTTSFSNLHLIYVYGLFDYLSDLLAARLTSNLFRMLAPGGKLLLANFTPDCYSRGYMEVFMDWSLIYREKQEMHKFALEIALQAIGVQNVFCDPHEKIAFLELVKAV